MKTRSLVAAVLVGALAVSTRAADAANDALQKGLLEEEANRNLDAAIQAYQAAIDQFDEQRKVAGTAVFRLAECYRKLGKTNEAAVQYQRVVRDFSDQTNLVTLSRKELDRMPQFRQRLQQIVSRANFYPNKAQDLQRELLQQELKLVEQQAAIKQEQRNRGVASSEDLIAAEREVLSIKRQIAALDAAVRPDLLLTPSLEDKAPAESPVADEETQEIRRLKALKENSPDLLDARDNSARTPLHYAVAKDFQNAVSYLLDQEVNANAGDQNGNTPLHVAVAEGRKTIVELLLARGANVNAGNAGGATSLHVAAAKGFKLIAEILIAKGADLNAVAGSSRRLYETTPGAAKEGFTDVWIESGTPLHNAVAQGYRNMVELLLAHKADVNPDSEDHTPLTLAARYPRADMVKMLLERGADLNARGAMGNTALHWALESGSEEIVGLLLPRKPQLELKNLQDLTPLQLAVNSGQVKLAQKLLQAGANPNVRFERKGAALVAKHGSPAYLEGDGKTPLHWAVEYGFPSLVQPLLEAKADVNAKDNYRKTPLHLAIGQRSKDTLKLLLAQKAEVNAKDKDGNTPLLWAVARGDKDAVELLLANGADVTLRNNDDQTPLDLVKPPPTGITIAQPIPEPRNSDAAPYASPSEIAEILKQHGAKE